MVHKFLQLLEIHEGNVVEVAELLSFQDDRLWDASLTTTLGVWWMEPTVVVHSVPLILRECAILALLIASVRFCTLFALRCNEAIEGVVLTICDHALIFVHAVWALLVRAVMAANFSRHN